MLGELSDITEIDSGSTFLKTHIFVPTNIIYRGRYFNGQNTFNRILEELPDDSGVDSGSIFPN
jgi:hypothetical protein